MGYAGQGRGGRKGAPASDRPTFTIAYDFPAVLATPFRPFNLAPLRPSSSTPSSSPLDVTSRRPRGVRYCHPHYHHDYKSAMSGTLSSYVPYSSSLDQTGR